MGIVLVAASVDHAAAAAEPQVCPSAVQVEGDVALVRSIRELLCLRGLAAEAPRGCPDVVAVVTPSAAGFEATIVDRDGRVATRAASDAMMMAMIIESWARPDLGAPLLAGADVDAEDASPAAARAAVDSGPDWVLGASAVAFGGSDESIWVGGELVGLVAADPLRIGLVLHGQADTGGATADSPGADADRLGLDLLAVLELPASVATPLSETERREVLETLAQAVAALPHDLRVAWLLCDVDEERCVDVAASLGVPVGTLYRRLHEARRQLRSSLAEVVR